MQRVLADGEVREKLAAQGLVIEKRMVDPAAFQAYLGAEIEKWRKVVAATGVSID